MAKKQEARHETQEMRRKKWMKKAVSLLVALVMLASIILAACAEENSPFTAHRNRR